MRRLHTLEIRDSTGEFLPKIGFSDLETLRQWMIAQLPETVLKQITEWRIVPYCPASPEPDPAIIH